MDKDEFLGKLKAEEPKKLSQSDMALKALQLKMQGGRRYINKQTVDTGRTHTGKDGKEYKVLEVRDLKSQRNEQRRALRKSPNR